MLVEFPLWLPELVRFLRCKFSGLPKLLEPNRCPLLSHSAGLGASAEDPDILSQGVRLPGRQQQQSNAQPFGVGVARGWWWWEGMSKFANLGSWAQGQ